MSTRMRDLLSDGFDQLRLEPIAERIRAVQAGGSVVDSTRAVLVWEPRRVVPSYAVPVEDVRGELVPESDPGTGAAGQAGGADTAGVRLPDVTSRPVLDPSIPFAVHTTAGQVVTVGHGGRARHPRPRLDLRGAAPRRRAGRRPHRLLRRAHRCHPRRPPPRTSRHPLVTVRRAPRKARAHLAGGLRLPGGPPIPSWPRISLLPVAARML